MIVKAGSEGYKQLLAGITIKNLACGERTHLTEVRLSKGAVVPEHQHPQEQTGYLISGSLRFFSSSGENVVGPGDSWSFAADEAHGAEALEDTVVLELFAPPREDYLNL